MFFHNTIFNDWTILYRMNVILIHPSNLLPGLVYNQISCRGVTLPTSTSSLRPSPCLACAEGKCGSRLSPSGSQLSANRRRMTGDHVSPCREPVSVPELRKGEMRPCHSEEVRLWYQADVGSRPGLATKGLSKGLD